MSKYQDAVQLAARAGIANDEAEGTPRADVAHVSWLDARAKALALRPANVTRTDAERDIHRAAKEQRAAAANGHVCSVVLAPEVMCTAPAVIAVVTGDERGQFVPLCAEHVTGQLREMARLSSECDHLHAAVIVSLSQTLTVED